MNTNTASFPTRLTLACCLVVLLVSCSSLFAPSPVDIPAGAYQGEYTVVPDVSTATTTSAEYSKSNVSISFTTDNTYAITPLEPGTAASPEESKGNYSLEYRKIKFSDRSPLDKVIDPARLITGEFEYTFDGTNLIMTQVDKTSNRKRQFFLLRRR